MTTPHNPFLAQRKAQPGHGTIHVANLTPSAARPNPVLQTLEYQYPLKLIAPSTVTVPASLPIPEDEATQHEPNRETSSQRGSRQGDSSQDVFVQDCNIPVYTVFLLSYGGGLVAGDVINLTIHLDSNIRLNLLTQGSTKVFKSRPLVSSTQPTTAAPPTLLSSAASTADSTATTASSTNPLTIQALITHLSSNSTLIYLPDPTQPFAHSSFAQSQSYILEDTTSNLCVLDWVSAGRPATRETWAFDFYESRNEIFALDAVSGGKGRLLVRDNIRLDAKANPGIEEGVGTTTGTETGADGRNVRAGNERQDNGISARVAHQAIQATLLITGPLFQNLSSFFVDEFAQLPRIGAPRSILLQQQYDHLQSSNEPSPFDNDPINLNNESDGSNSNERRRKEFERKQKEWREQRQDQEKKDGLLWTASSVREVFVIVKFSAGSVEGARRWLREMLEEEGSVERVGGERVMMCLR
ncbi:MAG: hypothetical protein Q9159_003412 [Coniocarpon cinnabarinum]